MLSRRYRSLGPVGAAVAMVGALVLPASAVSGGESVDVIVVLDDALASRGHDANRAEAARVARDHGISPTQTYGTALVGFAGTVPAARLQGLGNDPRVAYVDRDAPVEAYGQSSPWGIARIGAPLNGNTGKGVHVYVLDTGIDSNHPDLAANIGNGHAVETCKGPGRRCRHVWDDDHGHGTHVAGTVAALDNDIDVVGVAPEATLHAVKVLSNSGSGSRSGVIAGIDWVTKHVGDNTLGGKAVVNMSLGGSGSKTGTCSTTGFDGADSYHQSICTSTNAGVVFVVAAGNSSADAELSVPAAYDDAVLTVSATTSKNDWPYWSNWGDNGAAWTPHTSAPVALSAPGAGVLSTAMDGGTTTKSGTSMAAPHVAGAVALYLNSEPQGTDGNAFINVRTGLLGAAEPTAEWMNSSGYVHNEEFLDVRDFSGTTALAVGSLSASPNPFSPNSDGTFNRTTISFTVTKEASWTATVTDPAGGSPVLLCSENGMATATSFVWDGNSGGGACIDDQSAQAGEGEYTVTVTANADSEKDSAATTVTIDLTAPTISVVSAQNLTSTTADIVWTTDEPSTSTVRYWYGEDSFNESSEVLVKSHNVALSGLVPDTTYSFEVESVDAAGNTSTASGYTFKTKAASASSTLSVDGKHYSQFGGRLNNNHLDVTVNIVDETRTVIADVAVTIKLFRDGDLVTTTTAATGAGGDAIFQYRGIGPGCYSAVVDGASKDGYTFDGFDLAKTSCDTG